MLARDKHSPHGHIYHTNTAETDASVTRAPASAVNALMGRLGLAKETDTSETDEATLARELTDPAWSVRVEAAQQLGKLGKQAPLELLLLSLRDEQGSVRIAAARALSRNPRQAAVSALVAALDDTEWVVRVEVLMALGRLPASAPLELLLSAAQDTHVAVRAAAIWALGEVGTEAVTQALNSALQDDDWSVREAATLALSQINRPTLLHPRLEPAPVVQPTPTAFPKRDVEAATAYSISNISAQEHLTPLQLPIRLPEKPEPQPATRVHAVQFAELYEKIRKNQVLQARRWARKFERLTAGILAVSILVCLLVTWLIIAAWGSMAQTNNQNATALPSANQFSNSTTITTYRGHSSSVEKLAWSPDGSLVASADSRGMLEIWQASTGRTMAAHIQSGTVLALTWNDQNTVRAAYSSWQNHTLQVEELSLDNGLNVQHTIFKQTHLSYIPTLAAWSPDSDILAFNADNNSIQIWNVITHQYITSIQGDQNQFSKLLWSPGGDALATLSPEGIQIWDVTTGFNIQNLNNSQEAAVAVWSSSAQSGELLIGVSASGELMRWQTPGTFQTIDQLMLLGTGQLFINNNLNIAAINLSPDGTQFALAISDGTIQARDAATLNLIDIYSGHNATVNDLGWSPDGRTIATASTDTTVQIWQEP